LYYCRSSDWLLDAAGPERKKARLARAQNNANVLSMGARVIAPELALEVVGVFASTAFEGERHVARYEETGKV
jgi:ribose 5-phosphate isomerase B